MPYLIRLFVVFQFFLVALIISNDIIGQSDYNRDIRSFLSSSNEQKALSSTYDFIITDQVFDKHSGLTHVYVQHTVDGLPIIGSISGFHFDAADILKYSSLKIPNTKIEIIKKEKRVRTPVEALDNVANILKLPKSSNLEKSNRRNAKEFKYSSSKMSTEDIYIREAIVEKDEAYVPIWEVGIYEDKNQKWHVLQIDISTGQELERGSWTAECFDHEHHSNDDYKNARTITPTSTSIVSCDSSYNVFAYPLTSPSEGIQTLVTRPWQFALEASPSGWNDTSFLRGNNAYTVEDIDSNNGGGYTTDGGSQLCFDAIHYDTLSVSDNLDASLINAFYWNNLIHDVMYYYGFDEVAGNFQQSNFGRGGSEFDRVNVDILDGSGLNNANFSTPPDGFQARMQMFEWVPSIGNFLQIEDTSATLIELDMLPALFGPNDLTLTDTILIADPLTGCDTIENDTALIGQIALIDRGDCTFEEKALAIQMSGAIAMIVCNNDATDIFRMGGDDSDSITIPSIMVGKLDCDTLKMKLENGIVTATMTIPSTFDSGLDNGIVIHEYAHGISTRLTGGPSAASCLSGNEQMGEGWSDWYALMFTLDASDFPEEPKVVGAYVLGEDANGAGIRNFPYSTDLSVNPVTYDDIKSLSVPHGVGTVWASALWDMTWNLIDEHGLDADIYNGVGGNNMALNLVTLALKLQPCDPGFVDGRDAILAADEILYDGMNTCLIWDAFARRGIGYFAEQGSSVSNTDGTENFDLPPLCDLPLIYSSTTEGVAITSDTLAISFDIRTNLTALDTGTICADLTNELTYYAGAFTTLKNDSITFLETDIDSSTFVNNEIEVLLTSKDSSAIYYLERVDRVPSGWMMTSDQGSQAWEISDTFPYQDSLHFFCKNVEDNQTHFLISPTFSIDGPTFMGFWHYYNLEENWDGGFVELSMDNGQTWIDIGLNAVSNGYKEKLKLSSNSFSEGRLAFSGTNTEYQQTIIDLSQYAGSDIQIRFVLASDRFAFEEGWYIDNISLYHKYEIEVHSLLKTDEEVLIYDTLSIIVMPACEPCLKDLCDSVMSSITSIDKGLYTAFHSIQSDAIIPMSNNVTFLAGDSILLKENFTVADQAIFQAIIDECVEP